MRCVVGPKRVVSEYSLDTGAEKRRRFAIRYRDGRWDRKGNGFLGFGMRIVHDLDTMAGSATEYDLRTWDEDLRAFPFAREVKASWSWAPSLLPGDFKVEVGYSTGVFTAVPTHGEKTFFPVTVARREVRAQAYSIGDVPLQDFAKGVMQGAEDAEIVSEALHLVGDVDLFGNVLEEVTKTEGLDVRVTRTVKNDEERWILGMVEQEETCREAGGEKACVTTRATFDKRGRVRWVRRDAGDDETKVGASLTYDAFGNVVKTVAADVMGNRRASCVSYEEEGVFPFARKNALGHRWFEKFDPGTGVRIAEVDPNDLVTQWAMDGFGRLTREKRPDGTETTSTMAVVDGHIRITASSLGWGEETVELDLLGRTLRSWSPGVGAAPRILREVAYDDLGERIARRYVPEAETAIERKYEEITYDPLGREAKVISPWGGVSTTVHEGRKVIETNARGQVTETALDGLGRAVVVKSPENMVTKYEYDVRGLKREITPGDIVTTYERDALGRVSKVKDPDRGEIEVHYNGFDEVWLTRDALGREVWSKYDSLGRVVERHDEDGSTVWNWDTLIKGALSEVRSPEGAVQETLYDSFGRVSGSRLVLDGETFTVDYKRDAAGRVMAIDYPGFSVTNQFDGAGHLVGVEGYWSLTSTDGAGRITGEVLGKGISTKRGWFADRARVESIVSKAADGTKLQDLWYAYDAEQNVTSRQDKRQGKTEWFSHDGLDRLTCASYSPLVPCQRKWAYAPNGNLIQTPDVAKLQYGDPLHAHAVTAADGDAFVVDAVGNQIERPGLKVTYNAFDMPRAFEAAAGVAAVVIDYAGDGSRIRKTTLEATTVYLDGLYERVTRASGEIEERYHVQGPERPIAVVTKKAGVTETKYLLVDALGSTDVVTDEMGGKAEWTSFDPFGKRRNPVWGEAPSGAGPPGVTVGFTGHEEDEELGLVNMRGRLFDPLISRYLTPDPLQTGWDPFAYVHNSPLKYVDPSGYEPQRVEPGDVLMPALWVHVPVGDITRLSRSGEAAGTNAAEVGGQASTGDVATTGAPAPIKPPAMAPGTYAEGRTTLEKVGEAVGGAGEALKEAPGNLAQGLISNLLPPTPQMDGGCLSHVCGNGSVDPDRALETILDGANEGNPILAVAIPVVDGARGVEKGNFEMVGKAVVEGTIAGVMVGITLKQVEQRAGLAPQARTKVHGNALVSERAQHVYEITRTDVSGKAETYKYGVSGGTITAEGASVRAANQVRRLNRRDAGIYTYEYSITHRIPEGPGARATALSIEKALVKQYEATHPAKPPGNKKP